MSSINEHLPRDVTPNSHGMSVMTAANCLCPEACVITRLGCLTRIQQVLLVLLLAIYTKYLPGCL